MTSCGVSSAAANAEYRCCNRGKLAATSSSAAAPTTTQQRARTTIVLFAASSLAALPQVSDPNLFSIHKSECYAVAFHRTALSAAVAELAGYCKSTAKRLQRLTANSGHAKTHSKLRSHVFVDSPASEKRTDEGACVACACAACQCICKAAIDKRTRTKQACEAVRVKACAFVWHMPHRCGGSACLADGPVRSTAPSASLSPQQSPSTLNCAPMHLQQSSQ
jgi:hypothetical protein